MTLWDLYEKCERTEGERGTVRNEETPRVVSMYITGELLMDFFCPELEFAGGEEADSVARIWYLICKYHENAAQGKEGCAGARISPDFDMEKNPVRFADGRCVKKSALTEEELLDFFYYRKICCKKRRADHGIAGGLLLYEALLMDPAGCADDRKRGCRGIYSYAAVTLMCHNAFVRDPGGKKSSIQEDPLLCLLLLAESVEPLHMYRGEINRKTMRMFLGAVDIEKLPGELLVTVDPDVLPFDGYTEKLLYIAEKTGVRVSVKEKSYKIHIKGVNSDDY